MKQGPQLEFDASPPSEATNSQAEAAALEAARRLLRKGYEVTLGCGAFEDGSRWIVRPGADERRDDLQHLVDELARDLGGRAFAGG